MKRYWINQPSTLQPLHRLHGTNVLGKEIYDKNTMLIYFITGDVISMVVEKIVLSEGWWLEDAN